MRIAVIGLGVIGRTIADALAGHADVVRVDRTRAPLRAGENAVDAALVTVKTPGTRWAAEAAAAILAPDGIAVTLQNGLGNRDALIERFGADRSLMGAVYFGAYEEPDGSLRTFGPRRITLARPAEPGPRARTEGLAAALRAAGFTVELADEVLPLLWAKIAVNVAVNPVTAILGLRNGGIAGHAGGAVLA
ncbi:MAG: hypothetical protein FJ034_04385, partial [Chloroflexi bacterium]|nr:hypothetical protein [Chloroflexota bacterium]